MSEQTNQNDSQSKPLNETFGEVIKESTKEDTTKKSDDGTKEDENDDDELPDLEHKIPYRAEEALKFRLKNYALKKCDDIVKQFVECTKDKYFSVAWACREEQKAMDQCMAIYSNKRTVNRLRHAYVGGLLRQPKTYEEMSGELEKKLEDDAEKESKDQELLDSSKISQQNNEQNQKE